MVLCQFFPKPNSNLHKMSIHVFLDVYEKYLNLTFEGMFLINVWNEIKYVHKNQIIELLSKFSYLRCTGCFCMTSTFYILKYQADFPCIAIITKILYIYRNLCS